MNQSKGEGWRELCAAAATEQDPEKLGCLVNKILKVLDERDQEQVCAKSPVPEP
jgi:hypothetical protein